MSWAHQGMVTHGVQPKCVLPPLITLEAAGSDQSSCTFFCSNSLGVLHPLPPPHVLFPSSPEIWPLRFGSHSFPCGRHGHMTHNRGGPHILGLCPWAKNGWCCEPALTIQMGTTLRKWQSHKTEGTWVPRQCTAQSYIPWTTHKLRLVHGREMSFLLCLSCCYQTHVINLPSHKCTEVLLGREFKTANKCLLWS
jgi:hypothetical protein